MNTLKSKIQSWWNWCYYCQKRTWWTKNREGDYACSKCGQN